MAGGSVSPDGAVDFLGAGPNHLTFRFGLQWREPVRSARPPDGLLPARYIRIQAASPPPERVDGTQWDDGLVVPGGGRFSRTSPSPTDAKVDPLDGVAPLGQPDPTTIVLDRWLAVPALPSSRALTRTFEIGTADPTIRPLSFLSAPYPDASIDGKRLAVVGVDYYYEGRIKFDRPAQDEWIAVSLERFFPPERASAEFIVRVPPTSPTERPGIAPETAPVTIAWSAHPPTTDIAKDTA